MEHRVILGGEQFLPFARSRIKALKATGLAYAAQKFEVDGATVRVRIEPGHEYIHIEKSGPYMESGVLDMQVLGGYADPNTFRPAKLLFTPSVEANLAAPKKTYRVNASESRKIKTSGQYSWTAAGCKKRITHVEYQSTSTLFEHDGEDFCGNSTLDKKRLMANVPPSSYTGKLRLFIQALYGSQRTEYEIVVGSIRSHLKIKTESKYSPVYDPTITLYHYLEIRQADGLLTVPTNKGNRYFYIMPGVDSISYYEFKGKKYDFDTPEGEAYTLSTLNTDYVLHTVSNGSLVSAGSPFAYGWHFNTEGNTAIAVMAKPHVIPGTTAAGVATTINAYQTTLAQLNLTATVDESSDEVIISYTVTYGASGFFIPQTQSRLLIPWSNGGAPVMKAVLPVQLPTVGTGWDCFADISGPVYCYYEKKNGIETPVVISASNTKQTVTQPSYAGNTRDGTNVLGVNNSEFNGPHAIYQTPGGRKWGPAGFSGPIGVTGVFDVTFGDKLTILTKLPDNYGFTNSFTGYSVSYYSPASTGGYSYWLSETNPTTLEFPILVIPHNDSSACILGKYSRKTSDGHTQTIYTKYSNNSPAYINDYGNKFISQYTTDTMPYTAYQGAIQIGESWNPNYFSFGDVIFTASGDPVADAAAIAAINDTVLAVTPTVSHTYTMTLCHGNGTQISLCSDVNGFIGLLEAAAADDIYYRNMEVNSAYFGPMKYKGLTPDNETSQQNKYANGWPETTSDSVPVGWA